MAHFCNICNISRLTQLITIVAYYILHNYYLKKKSASVVDFISMSKVRENLKKNKYFIISPPILILSKFWNLYLRRSSRRSIFNFQNYLNRFLAWESVPKHLLCKFGQKVISKTTFFVWARAPPIFSNSIRNEYYIISIPFLLACFYLYPLYLQKKRPRRPHFEHNFH